MADNFFNTQMYNIVFKKRLTVSRLHIFLGILSLRIWSNDHREVNERMNEVLRIEWRGMALSARCMVGVWHY